MAEVGGERRAPATAPGFTLTVEPDPSHVRVARLFGAAVARHFGCSEESIADVKLALSEAVTAAVERESGPITVEMQHAGAALRVAVSPAGRGAVGGDEAAAGNGLGMTLIKAIFEDAKIEGGDPGVLRFSVPAGDDALRPEAAPR